MEELICSDVITPEAHYTINAHHVVSIEDFSVESGIPNAKITFDDGTFQLIYNPSMLFNFSFIEIPDDF